MGALSSIVGLVTVQHQSRDCMRCVGLMLVAFLASCSDPHGSADHQQLQAEINSLSTRLSALESQQSRLVDAESAGSWILWQRFDIVKSYRPIFGLAPARPMSAFSSKEECEREAQRSAGAHGGKPGASEYLESESTGISRVFYTCMPKGIAIQR